MIGAQQLLAAWLRGFDRRRGDVVFRARHALPDDRAAYRARSSMVNALETCILQQRAQLVDFRRAGNASRERLT